MRCTNCGWDNPNTHTQCEKCGSPLTGAQPVNNYGAAPVADAFAKTVNEGQVFNDVANPATPKVPKTELEEEAKCAHCGCLLRPGTSFCPQCGTPVGKVEPKATPAAQQVKADNLDGTINPWIQVAPKNKCTLTPLPQSSDEEAPASIPFKGDKHELNREVLDAENPTITSHEQAELTCVDGQWYICDKSQQHTTFVRASEPVALKDGDVILLGNRQFVFQSGK